MLINKPRVLEFMRQCQLDALVATSPISVTYFSDYYCWIDSQLKEYMRTAGGSGNLIPGFALFPREGSPALVVGSIFAINACDVWVKDLYLYGNPIIDDTVATGPLAGSHRPVFERLRESRRAASPVDALFWILKDRGLTEARIGLEAEGLSSELRQAIAQAFPHAEFRDCSDLLRVVRMVKTPEEIARIKGAAEIAESAAREALSAARPGTRTCELIQHYREGVARQGADFDHFAFGFRGLGVATEPDYRLESDDVMYVDFGCLYKRYTSDSGTTLAVTPPSKAVRNRHDALRASIRAGAEAMRPGVKSSEIQAAMARVAVERGIAVCSAHGHGLGLESCEYPLILPDNGRRVRDDCIDLPSDLPLEANMVINLEARNFLLGVDSIHTESSFLITEKGSEPLVHQERSTPVCPKPE